jgi:O-antigen/teichoic acid export membrane protein
MDSRLTPDGIEENELVQSSSAGVPHLPDAAEVSADAARSILSGTSTLAAAVMVERGATFAANILAARFAGASAFGAYSIGISTANNISTYAAGGIGATATRFSGKYPYDSGHYATFARVLVFVSLVSAAIAGSVLLLGAHPIAHILHKDSLAGLLRWAALPAAGMLILECARGFFVGQRRLAALALLSMLVGLGMILLLPATAARQNPAAMVTAHGIVTLTAVALCLLLAKPLRLLAKNGLSAIPFTAMLREVWGFGFIQLSGLLSANLSGWWITALVARSDATLVQMGFFAIASQFRNLTGIIPALLTEGSYAVIAMPDTNNSGTPQRVMALCTFASTAVAFTLACLGIIVAPWALHAMYGARYTSATVAAAIGMSVAVLQMGNAPPSARVSVVSIRSVAAINTFWAVLTAAGGSLLMLHVGGAAGAMLVFFLAHIASAILTFIVLARKDHLPAGLVSLFVLSTAGVASLSLLAVLRAQLPVHTAAITAAMLLLSLLCGFALFRIGKRRGWLTSLAKLRSLADQAARTLRCINPLKRKERV